MIIFMINGTSVKATSGFLRKNSIVTCNGITYGQHGDGHWHVAVKTIDGRYNASGSPIASNPCTDINNVENSQNNVSTSASDSQSKQTSKVINKSGDNTLKSLKIDNEKIYIKIYNSEQVPIENRGYIYLDSIKKRFLIKLNKLALIYASKKKINNDLYFRYYKIECFKYQGIDSFIKCLEQETIKVSLILRFSRNQKTFGKNKNKGLVFTISKNELDLLFNKVYYEEN